MDEFVCITVRSKPGESEADFAARLSRFWTHMLRQFQTEFEKVYAEATSFEPEGDRCTRQYMAEPGVVPLLEREMPAHDVDFHPIDLDETYSKYEVVSPEWMQIEH